MTRVREDKAIQAFLCLGAVISLYRIGRNILAPGAPCHCGGFRSLGLSVANSLPGWFFAMELIFEMTASAGVLALNRYVWKLPLNAPKTASVASAVVVVLILSSVTGSAEVPKDLDTQVAFPLNQNIGATGVVTITFPNRGTPTPPEVITYPFSLFLSRERMLLTNGMPDGSRTIWLFTPNEALSVTSTSNTIPKGSSVVTNVGHLLHAGTVHSLKESFGMMEPEALVWISLLGGMHAANGGYLKPPQFAISDPLSWMAKIDVIAEEAGLRIPSMIRFTITREQRAWNRAAWNLSGRRDKKQLLTEAKLPYSRFADGFKCGEYSLIATTNIGGMTLPELARYQVFLPPETNYTKVQESDNRNTNRLGTTHMVLLRYYLPATTIVLDTPEFETPVDILDTRTVTDFRMESSVFYKLKKMAIPATNDPIFRESLLNLKRRPMTSSEITRRLYQLGIGTLITLLVFGTLITLLFCIALTPLFLKKAKRQ